MATKVAQVGKIQQLNKCIKLIYEFLIGEPPKQWISVPTLTTWHKNISQICINDFFLDAQTSPCFGVMVDESTRGETKYFIICFMFWSQKTNMPIATISHLENLLRCNGETIADTIINTIVNSRLDVNKCAL